MSEAITFTVGSVIVAAMSTYCLINVDIVAGSIGLMCSTFFAFVGGFQWGREGDR